MGEHGGDVGTGHPVAADHAVILRSNCSERPRANVHPESTPANRTELGSRGSKRGEVADINREIDNENREYPFVRLSQI